MSCLLLLFIMVRADAQWPQFRGPNGAGVDSSVGYSTHYSEKRCACGKLIAQQHKGNDHAQNSLAPAGTADFTGLHEPTCATTHYDCANDDSASLR